MSSYRYDKQVVDVEVAKSEAARLRDLILTKQFDHHDLEVILSARNFFHLRATFDWYQQNFGKSIQEVSFL